MERTDLINRIGQLFLSHTVVSLLGPRQVGKTTLARNYWQVINGSSNNPANSPNYFDLEDPLHLSRLSNPKLALEPLQGLVVIDEIQRSPDLFPILRVLVDRPDNRAKFLILGSASRDLIKQSSESLAGRLASIEVSPFSVKEVGVSNLDQLWVRGGFPRSFLASSDQESKDWLASYIQTFLERDIPSLGIQIPASQLRRFWLMVTHVHGNVFNASELGRSLGIADTTARRYLDILQGTFMLRVLQPWFENIGKRQVKSPKVYFRDSGILHQLMGVFSLEQLMVHPKLGASWEGFVIEQIIRKLQAIEQEVYFWGVPQQGELDLLIIKDGKRHGFEIKYTDYPTLTKSMFSAITSLKLDSFTIAIPGEAEFELDRGVKVIGANRLIK